MKRSKTNLTSGSVVCLFPMALERRHMLTAAKRGETIGGTWQRTYEMSTLKVSARRMHTHLSKHMTENATREFVVRSA